jgi:hypothetical protein
MNPAHFLAPAERLARCQSIPRRNSPRLIFHWTLARGLSIMICTRARICCATLCDIGRDGLSLANNATKEIGMNRSLTEEQLSDCLSVILGTLPRWRLEKSWAQVNKLTR